MWVWTYECMWVCMYGVKMVGIADTWDYAYMYIVAIAQVVEH